MVVKNKRKPKTKSKKDGRGGKRTGAGRKSGGKNIKTIEIDRALELIRTRINEELEGLLTAQFDKAKGTVVVLAKKFEKDPKTKKVARTGAFARVTNITQLIKLFNGSEEGKDYYRIYTRDPDTKALENLMNRLVGKPKEQVDFNFGKETLQKLQDSNVAIFEIAKQLAHKRLGEK